MSSSLAFAVPDHDERTAIDAASFVLGLRARGIRHKATLGAMERVPRPLFAPRRFADLARTDVALPLPCGQTMTAPSAIATMLVALDAGEDQRVLEIGTGSGYVTALLAQLGCRVTTVERFASLADEARVRLPIVGAADTIDIVVADGLAYSSNDGPFDRIILNGSVAAVPASVTSQLAPGGRLIGALALEGVQRLIKIERPAEEGGLTHVLGPALRLSRLIDARTRG
jgi:protein-L-isoaspartate(D-aspartate) O-methyltransferase